MSFSPPEQPQAGSDGCRDGLRVIIVEDDARVRGALRAFLSALPGLDVIAAAAGAAEALGMARDLAPAVALVDVLLPQAADGLGLLRTLTGELRIPVVAISISGGLRSHALAAGAHEFLGKDSPPELMVAALHAAAAGQAPRQSF